MKVKHPLIALTIWFGLGTIGAVYGLSTVVQWIIFIFGALMLYTIYYKMDSNG